ncbi:hypothetical protein NN3_24620 [Nocardia neocaledoniensis NBRC 108232]|uniref:Uncharacterized protein n=1 Tax=Nocardia neocaledoniensis TaxID=236511 RepID=A0A317NM94_9NOCA|nr:hypothetical protein [Nocardia neocaledoniensis]PWV76127.1 hypothetical protein DFR69_104229 [Nocardia neocaledoniensis]GEM31455.1 hypothetical protein NN3_24620 [Nocardia neocaledoniensis NBRC 108232]
MTTIRLDHPAAGIVTLRPDGAPTALDAAAALDTLVLEVTGGHLTWSLLAGQQLPAATLDDTEAAQDWLWAVYGENIALAIADDEGHHRELTATPARPELVTALRRLAYAHWASRWWPASTIDSIPALDRAVLAKEIAELSAVCESVVAGADDPDSAALAIGRTTDVEAGDLALALDELRQTERARDNALSEGSPPSLSDDQTTDSAPTTEPSDSRLGRDHTPADGQSTVPRRGRAEDYALAAGGEAGGTGLALARGDGDWDWRCCPPGLVDAGARSVSWQVRRGGGVTTVEVTALAAPDCPRDVSAHLRPLARLRAGDTLAEVPLVRRGDAWFGELRTAEVVENVASVAVLVPGVGPEGPLPDESATRTSIRDFVRHRLDAPQADDMLAAELAAAEDDSDF